MTTVNRPLTILLADDDPDDRMLTSEALEESRWTSELFMVEDGEQLIDFLAHTGKYAGSIVPRPDLIVLDLNMPRKDGREALAEIKANPEWRRIPVVVMTTSKAEEDISRIYDLGANSFITKPLTFEGLVDVVTALGQYWAGVVQLPEQA